MMEQTAFVGTFTEGSSQGIYRYNVTAGDEPSVRPLGVSEVNENPSFLAIHPNQRHLYAIHEVEDGGASAYRIEDGESRLSGINRVPSGSGGPCHCHVHPSGDYLFVAHYTGGAVSVLPIRDDASLGPPVEVVEHTGSGEHPDRQARPHPHSITPGPLGRFVYVPDLGTDEIVVYRFDQQTGALERVSAVDVRPGAGPRHLDFHPNGRYVYVTNELDSTLTAFEHDTKTGDLIEVGTKSSVSSDFSGENFPADIHVHPSGKWVLCSNRGHDSIAVFEIDPETGAMRRRSLEGTRGEWPRSFALDHSGRLLLVENRHTDDIIVFEFDDQTGGLDAVRNIVDVPDPVCLQLRSPSE